MKKHLPIFKTIAPVIVCLSTLPSWAWAMENEGNYDIGDGWEKGSIASRGFTEIASNVGGRGGNTQRLEKLIHKYIRLGSLEITPENYEGLVQASTLYETACEAYNKGIFVKGWKSSLGTEGLLNLLFKFTHITKFALNIDWDQPEVEFSETIAHSVQFFEDLGELSIAGCRLTDAHMDDIMESIMHPEKLKILDIRNNALTPSTLPKIRNKFTKLVDVKTELIEAEEVRIKADQERVRQEEPKKEKLGTVKTEIVNDFVDDDDSLMPLDKGTKSSTESNAKAIDAGNIAVVKKKEGTHIQHTTGTISFGLVQENSMSRLSSGSNIEKVTTDRLETKTKGLRNDQEGAEKGKVDTSYSFSRMSQLAEKVPEHLSLAAQWFEQAAHQGHRDAQFVMSVMYLSGTGVPEDMPRVAHWLRAAADQNHPGALLNLGIFHYTGEGEPHILKDMKSSFGALMAASTLPPESLTEDDKPFVVKAQALLGRMFQNGEGVERNLSEAVGWLSKAAESGHPEAKNSLAILLLKEKDLPKDEAKILRFFQEAADPAKGNSSFAQYNLAMMYLSETGGDDSKALEWFTRSAAQGHLEAHNQIGLLYQDSNTIPCNDDEAIKWFKLAADKGHQDAKENLAIMQEIKQRLNNV